MHPTMADSGDITGLCQQDITIMSVQAYARLHMCQREQGISGHVVEVGVYQGRGFIPLCLLCGPQVSTAFEDTIHPHLLT
jgi:hypothetical protein